MRGYHRAVNMERGISQKEEQFHFRLTYRNFCPCGAKLQVEIKRISEESLGPSALFTDFNYYLSAELLL